MAMASTALLPFEHNEKISRVNKLPNRVHRDLHALEHMREWFMTDVLRNVIGHVARRITFFWVHPTE